MKLLEYEAKSLLETNGIPIPKGDTCSINESSLSNLQLPVVVKSQVPTGGRGKLGGIKLVKTSEEFEQAVETLFQLSIKGFVPKSILVEEAVDIEREYYLSLTINRSQASIDLIAHPEGGMEVEEQTDFMTYSLDEWSFDRVGEQIAELFGLESRSFALQDLIEKLYHCFVKNDATLLEINPLILTTQSSLIAGDCKMTLDDTAAFRHPEWDFEEKAANANFVSLNQSGTVATIANGAGLAMATVDAVKAAGLTPANFLDIGGGATVDGIVKSFAQIMEFSRVNAIIINIFGGIVRCDDVARAIIEARRRFENLPKLYIRLSGTNSQEAAKLLENERLVLYPDLAACVEGVRRG